MEKKNISDLPEGWTESPLREVAQTNPRHPKALDPSLKVSFVPMSNVNESSWKLNLGEERELGKVRNGYTHFADGDVLFAKITPCMENGKAAVAAELTNGLGCGTTELHVLRPQGSVESKYLYYFLHRDSFRQEAARNFTGTAGQLRVPSAFIQEAYIPLPPLSEQRRIVAKLEELLDKVEACQKRVSKIPVTLKRFRRSTLDLAITGRLTADWRTDHQQTCNAKEDLRVFREQKQNKTAINTRVEPNEGCGLLTDRVPVSWETPTLGDVFLFIDYRGKNPRKSHQGKRLITAKNIKMGYLSDNPVEFVSNETYRGWMTRGFPKKDDLLFVTEGATMGFVALSNREDEFALAQRTLGLQPFHPIDTKIFLYFMMSSSFQDLVRFNATGSAAIGIKAAKFRGLPIPFPPVGEQREIVRRVEALFKFADQIEARYQKTKAQVDQLTQSILAKAFRGELVPTEAELARREGRDFEPASTLLDRVLKHRVQPTGRAKARRVVGSTKQ